MPSNTTQTQLDHAFEAVANPSDWRAPIDITLDVMGALEAAGGWAVVREAIQHFTATVPTIVYGLGARSARIRAIGYRAGPAGDH